MLVDLKIGELTRQNIGQMNGHVRICEAHGKIEGDDPAVGLIPCAAKNAAVARYSVLNDSG